MSGKIDPLSGLNPCELRAVGLLAQAWNAFMETGESISIGDQNDFRKAIHDAERVIMSRAFARMYPEYWGTN